jgi:poly(3-hydroxybutyrate) depolymerase
MSAGGAAAAIMGDAYPDLYAAIGVHSGLACGAARDVASAFTAMRDGAIGRPGGCARDAALPAIIFHGASDSTVDPSNSDALVQQVARSASIVTTTTRHQTADGKVFDRSVGADADGAIVFEQWNIHGAGHAWSGGSALGSYTDPTGPDATGEMVRFFLQNAKA